MSEPLLGEAATIGPEPTPSGGGNGPGPDERPPQEGTNARAWEDGESDALVDVAGDGADGVGTGTRARRRRRGSRGGRSHRRTASTDRLAGEDDQVGAGGGEEPANSVAVPDVVRVGEPELGSGASPADASAAAPETMVPGSAGRRAAGSAALAIPLASPIPTDVALLGLAVDITGAPGKPKIGDTRPGSPPVPRRRPRKETSGGPAGRDQDDGEVSVSVDDGEEGRARARRGRRRKSLSGELANGPVLIGNGPEGVNGSVAAAGVAAPRRAGGLVEATVAGKGEAGPGSPSLLPAALASEGGKAARGADRAREGGSRRGSAERRSRPLGRYLMVVHVGPTATQIAVLEGRTLIEHYVSRPADDATQIDGNIYLGRVQNVLPGMEAAFVDIGTPKNAVLYRGDLRYDEDEVGPASDDDAKPTRGRLGGPARDARIEQLLRTGQNIICQVTKNPIGTKGARLTQEVSLPGRFVVLIPDSDTYGISKRLGDDERRRLRRILDEIRPAGHGLIVRTAAEGASADELGRDVARLLRQWEAVQQLAESSRAPQLLYREPDLAVRVIREEFNRDYRGVVIDDLHLYEQVREYVASITPELADRVEFVDPTEEPLPLFERFRVHEQVHKALDRKVWLPSGGSLIIERTEALTVIDVNTGKNVGTSNLEETV
ncbi:MAG TPA: ribonuclease E/G, partial [Acidimicrobiales bacterium]|nr:ribonuclease E/G [Acidimicrobiales bacterium]